MNLLGFKPLAVLTASAIGTAAVLTTLDDDAAPSPRAATQEQATAIAAARATVSGAGGAALVTSSISGDKYQFRTLTDMMPVDLGATYEALIEDAKAQIAAGNVRYVAMDADDALERIDDKLAPVASGIASWARSRGIEDDVQRLMESAVGAAATGNPIAALGMYRLALTLEPKKEAPGILINMAGLANMLGMPSEALALLEEAEDLLDGTPSAALYANRGHALILVRRYAEAEAPLRKALQITPYLMEATRNLAVALALQGKKKQSKDLMPSAVWRRSVNEKFDYVAHGVEGDPFSEDQPVAIEIMAPRDLLDMERGVPGRLPKLTIPTRHKQLAAWERESTATLEAAMTAQMNHMAKVQELLQVASNRPDDYSQNLANYLHDYVTGRLLSRVGVDGGMASSGEGEAGGELQADWQHFDFELKKYPKDLRQLQRDLAIAQVKLNKAVDEHMKLTERLQPYADGERADANGCFPTDRRNADMLLDHIVPAVTEFDKAVVALHTRAHLEATGIASNLGDQAWHRLLGTEINAWTAETQGFRAITMATALQTAVGVGGRCSLPEGLPKKAEEEDAPFCTPDRQEYSFKIKISDIGSIEATCGKAKVVVEHDVMEKLLGVHAELEFTAQGEVTVFAGPKLTAGAVELGPLSADFGFKNGIYITAGPEGVKDFGHRMVQGGGVNVGNYGGTHDVDQVDMSLNISRADIVSAFTGKSGAGIVNGPPTEAAAIGR